MKILSISTQKPHSTGSGTYLSELVRSFERMGYEQAVVAGIYPSDAVEFPKSVKFYPVYYTPPEVSESKNNALRTLTFRTNALGTSVSENTSEIDNAGSFSPRDTSVPTIHFPVLGMSDTMPYPSTRYAELTASQLQELEAAFTAVVAHAIQDLQPDIILCHHLFLLTAILRKNFPSERIYGLCHGSDLRQMYNLMNEDAGYGKNTFTAAEISGAIQKLDQIFALHKEQKQQIMKYFSVPSEQVTVIGTGYNDSIFCPVSKDNKEDFGKSSDSNKPFRFIFAGKICREKGIAELLQALQLLKQEIGNSATFELHLAGGCKDSVIESMLTHQSLTPGWLHSYDYPICYHGLLNQNELADLYRHCDAFVLPSYYEGLPLVLIEAMACGLSTLCNDLPGVQSWLSEEIPHCNTIFVSLPRMKSADQPEADDLPDYIFRLKEALKELWVSTARNGSPRPDTSGATWDAVAKRIL